MEYPRESFTPAERERLAPHVTHLDRPVFALVGLPETVKGALFARYSRYPGTLRRLFLDEFADSLPETAGFDGDEGRRAAELYERIFVGYGDDSVAQLGGAGQDVRHDRDFAQERGLGGDGEEAGSGEGQEGGLRRVSVNDGGDILPCPINGAVHPQLAGSGVSVLVQKVPIEVDAHHHVRAQIPLEDLAGGDPNLDRVVLRASADVAAGRGDQPPGVEFIVHLEDLVSHVAHLYESERVTLRNVAIDPGRQAVYAPSQRVQLDRVFRSG